MPLAIRTRQELLRTKATAVELLHMTFVQGQCPELQRTARCIVSQCTSSSGCQRNWRAFALVHTKKEEIVQALASCTNWCTCIIISNCASNNSKLTSKICRENILIHVA